MDEYIINKQGAKVYKDSSKNETLPIPTVSSTNEKGVVYEVLSAGILGDQGRIPIVTIKGDNENKAYILPLDLYAWVEGLMMNKKADVSLLPCKVEFGCLSGRYYAEML
ncbi:hypothetical protein [Cytobacillus sp. IB215665]|uniref:hypothetical protein n=1 Tax=Cytobacillus sp. IB215665 TaxID=3097357 RepID=UPI002A147BA6|nr:hypothetical protein [Cytobacillus sp. IB215665]MDX8367145.1 hypothetical protein [Cytobacillus sp. IB215665]